MLNENLARVRKERGLTQEALAVKLNVVRQTISKWENGTAVPDADTLCRIAEALEISVAELLGNPLHEEKMDMDKIAKSLAEINEQLAVRNRRTGKALKIICGIIIGVLALIIIIIVLYIVVGKTSSGTVTVVKVDSADVVEVGDILELDDNGIPLFDQIDSRNEHTLQEHFGARNITPEQLKGSWGIPDNEDEHSITWKISDNKVITVYFADSGYAYDCKID